MLSGGLAVAGVGMVLIRVVPGDLTYPIAAVAMAMAGAGAGSLAIGSAMIMAGTPPAKAGNAAAIEETAYDLGTVLGVAVLGSLASLVYRQQLDVDRLVDDGLPAPLGVAAEDSLGAATAIADEAGLPALADQAGSAFMDALATTSLVGGLVMIVVAVVVLVTAPRGLDVTQQQH